MMQLENQLKLAEIRKMTAETDKAKKEKEVMELDLTAKINEMNRRFDLDQKDRQRRFDLDQKRYLRHFRIQMILAMIAVMGVFNYEQVIQLFKWLASHF